MTNRRLPTARLASVSALLCGAGTVTVGVATWLGWLWNLRRLTAWRTDLVPMSPLAACLSIMIGAALILDALGASRGAQAAARRLVTRMLTSVATVLSAALLYLRATGRYAPIEHLGMHIEGAVHGAPVGYIAFGTALCFLIAGASLLAWQLQAATSRRPWTLVIGGSLVMGAGVGVIIANLVGGRVFYDGARIPPAINTSVCLLLVGLGLLLTAVRDAMEQPAVNRVQATGRLLNAMAFCTVAVATGIGGYAFYQQEVQEVDAETQQELTTISQLRVRELDSWRSERLWDGLQTNRNTVSEEVLRAFHREGSQEVRDDIFRRWLQRYFMHDEYDRVMLLDANGAREFSLPDGADTGWITPDLVQAAGAALRERSVRIHDFYVAASDVRPSLALLIPVASGPSGRDRPLGVVCLRIDPERALYPVVREWPSHGQSAESLLVRRDGDDALYLSDLKHAPSAEVRRRATSRESATLAYQVVHGARGVVSGVNYEGRPVLGVVAAIPNSPWFLVVQTNVAEVRAELLNRLGLIVAFGSLLLSGTGLTLGWIYRGQQRAYAQHQLELASALRESEERLRLAVAASNQAAWDLDVATKTLTVGESYAQLQDLPADTTRETTSDLRSRVHPDDLAAIRAIYQDYLAGRRAELSGEIRTRRRDGSWRWFLVTGRLVARDEDGHPMRVAGLLADITDRKASHDNLQRSEDALRATANQLRTLLSNSPTVVYTMRRTATGLRAVDVSDNIERIFGYTRDEALDPAWWLAPMAPEDRAHAQAAAALITERDEVVHEFRFHRKDGGLSWVQDTLRCTARDESGPIDVVGAWTDITDRKLAELRTRRLTRLYATLSACNQAIVRSANPDELYWAVCKAAVEQGGIELAWIGLADPERARVVPVAVFGNRPEYLDGITISTDANSPFGQGPSGRAVREDRPVWSENFSTDPATAAWHQRARPHQWAVSGALPLRREGRAIGTLTIYTRDTTTIDHDARELLVEMAANISYALDNFAREDRRTEADRALRASVHEKDVLIKEVHHRVKNNLQLISSLLRLESGRSSNTEVHSALTEMQGRILSMALLHETLYRSSSLAHVNLGQYLSQLARQVFRSLAPSGHLTLQIEAIDAEIEPDQAIPCGLLVNELVSNAIKHGFPDGRSGQITVRLEHEGDKGLRLSVIDDGVGLPADLDSRRASSLGLHLVTVLARQLDGALASSSDAGTRFTLQFVPRLSIADLTRIP